MLALLFVVFLLAGAYAFSARVRTWTAVRLAAFKTWLKAIPGARA